MTYTATLTTASLRLRESRIVAGLLLSGADSAEWTDSVVRRDVLQLGRAGSIRRIAGLLRARLEPLGPGLWEMVRDGGRDLATQATFAACVKQSRLLGDFMWITVRAQLAAFAPSLTLRDWREYIEGCRGREPNMPAWSDATEARLRSAVFSMMAEVGYLDDARRCRLQPVFMDSTLGNYLRGRGETYVLRCMDLNS